MIAYVKVNGGGKALRSNASNMYELFKDTAQAIMDEPLRYDQRNWVLWHVTYHRGSNSRLIPPPPCGTVACRAGWAVLLAGRKSHKVSNAYDTILDMIKKEVRDRDDYHVLIADLEHLFRGDALNHELGYELAEAIDNARHTPEGAAIYAAAGVTGITGFINKWFHLLTDIKIDNTLADARVRYISDGGEDMYFVDANGVAITVDADVPAAEEDYDAY